MIEWLSTPMYSPIEVVGAIFLALVPGSRLAEILITIFEKKTGIKVPRATTENDE